MQPHVLLREAYRQYLTDKPPIVVPNNIVHHPNHVRASGLGGCSTEHAYSKAGTIPTNPEVMDDDKRWLFDGGNAAAERHQKSLMYWAQTHTNVAFIPEFTLKSDDYRLAGRADGILTIDNDQWVLEFKETEGMIKRSVGEPKLSYCFQMMAYMMMADIPQAMLVTMSRWSYHCWYLKPVRYTDLSKGFVLTHENGTVFAAEWNTPDTLNYSTVLTERAHLSDEMDVARDVDWLKPMIDKPLEHPEGFRCFWVADKGKKTDRNGTPPRPPAGKPNCQFFNKCHGKYPVNADGLIELIPGKGDELSFPEKL